MSSKGKGNEVIELSDTDSDTEFFTAKKRTYAKPLPTTRGAVTEPIVISDSDSDGGSQKKRRKKALPKTTTHLPEWARSDRSRKKCESSEDNSASARGGSNDPLSVLTDDDEPSTSKKSASPGKGKGKGKEKAPARKTVELTPPPQLSADVQARLKERLFAHWKETEEEDDEDEDVPSSPPPAANGSSVPTVPTVMITISMVADPDRKATASAKAIAHYERPQIYHVLRNSPLSDVVEVLAERIQKRPQDLLLVYEDKRLYAMTQTPGQLGIMYSATMVAYEKVVWEKVQELQRKAERERLFGDDDDFGASPTGSPSKSKAGSPAPDTAAASVPEPVEDENKVKMKLRGAAGELNTRATKETKVSTLIKYYCTKFNIAADRAAGMYLDLDGEQFTGDSTVNDLDLEDGDMVDVKG